MHFLFISGKTKAKRQQARRLNVLVQRKLESVCDEAKEKGLQHLLPPSIGVPEDFFKKPDKPAEPVDVYTVEETTAPSPKRTRKKHKKSKKEEVVFEEPIETEEATSGVGKIDETVTVPKINISQKETVKDEELGADLKLQERLSEEEDTSGQWEQVRKKVKSKSDGKVKIDDGNSDPVQIKTGEGTRKKVPRGSGTGAIPKVRKNRKEAAKGTGAIPKVRKNSQGETKGTGAISKVRENRQEAEPG